MAKPCGQQDSRPEVKRPKAGKLDRTSAGKSVNPVPTGSESFADRAGGKESMWRGQPDNR